MYSLHYIGGKTVGGRWEDGGMTVGGRWDDVIQFLAPKKVKC